MDREKLFKKREKLKVELNTSRQMRLISNLVTHLDSKEIEYHVHIECEVVNNALKSYPSNFSGLDWDIIPNSKIVHYRTQKERDQTISNAITECLNMSEMLYVTWSNALRPTIELSVKEIMKDVGRIADEDFDMWILSLERGFCLEHYHEGYVAWTTA